MKEIPYICGAHFYDPPRSTYHQEYAGISTDPKSEDWLQKVYEDNYKPVSESRLLTRVSYDINAVLIHELEAHGLSADGFLRNADNVIGTSYIHTILPDLSTTDKEIVIGAGLERYRNDFGKDPLVFWSPEAAMDSATAEVLVDYGYQAFVCSPRQLDTHLHEADNRFFNIPLPSGRSITAIAYDRKVSKELAYGEKYNADDFARQHYAKKKGQFNNLITWVDGETFGHHWKFGDLFLNYLLFTSLPEIGIQPTPINQFDFKDLANITARLKERSAWSCECGDLRRWHSSCGCYRDTENYDSSWVDPFYSTFAWLNTEISTLAQQRFGRDYTEIMIKSFEQGFVNPGGKFTTPDLSLIAAAIDGLTARTSCGTFFSSPHTSGRINMLFGLEAITHLKESGETAKADRLLNAYFSRLDQIVDPTNYSQTLLRTLETMVEQKNLLHRELVQSELVSR